MVQLVQTRHMMYCLKQLLKPSTPPLAPSFARLKELLRQFPLMASADPEFVAYMRTQNFTLEDATDVAEKLSVAGLHSASDFLGFYNTKGTDMYRFWADQTDWQGKGGILARLRHMFDNLEASAASAKQQDALLMDPEKKSIIPSTRRHMTHLRDPGCPYTDTACTPRRKGRTRSWKACGDPC